MCKVSVVCCDARRRSARGVHHKEAKLARQEAKRMQKCYRRPPPRRQCMWQEQQAWQRWERHFEQLWSRAEQLSQAAGSLDGSKRRCRA